MIPDLITFSDTAKYADAARSLAEGAGYVVHHSFYDVTLLKPGVTSFVANFPPLPSWIMAFLFSIFGSNDRIIVGVGIFTYLVLALCIFGLTKKFFSSSAGLFATLLFFTDPYFYFYARNFTPELLISLWILLAVYILTLPGKNKMLVLVPIFLSYLTKQQYSVIFVAIILTAYIWITRGYSLTKKVKFALVAMLGLLFLTMIGNLNVASNLSPIKAMYSANMLPGVIPGDYLRGEITAPIGIKAIVSKLFYNVYNFGKEPTRLTSQLILFLALLALGVKTKIDSPINIVRNFAYLLLVLLIFACSISLPNARYVHPVTPLLCVLGGAVFWELSKKSREFRTPIILLVVLSLIPVIGSITIDYRYLSKINNFDKPTSVKVISQAIDDHTDKGLIITNLDAWGAWYNRLNTMWFPLSIKQIADKNDVSYIAITDYNASDADFRLNDWGILFENNGFEKSILSGKYVMIYKDVIKADQVRENKDIKIVILKKNDK